MVSLAFGLVWLGGIGAALAIVFGVVARRQIAAAPPQNGSGIALAGIVLGAIGLVASLGPTPGLLF